MNFRNKSPNGALTFKYTKEEHKGKTIYRPRVEIRLSNGINSIKIVMLVDSGADVSFIPKEVAETLELDIITGEKIIASSASEKFETMAKIVDAELIKGSKKINIGKMEVRVSLKESHTDTLNSHALLGRSSFFKKFDITFRENTFKIILKKPKKK